MHMINMVDDFRVLVKESQQLGKWQAFKGYYEKYPDLWEKVCGYIYMINLEGLQPMVEEVDFIQLLQQVEANEYKINHIEEIVKAVARDLDFNQDFNLYVGGGLGHIGGTALPSEVPMLYIGVECLDQYTVDLEYLIAHEMSHMIRAHKVKQLNPNAFKERVITEGIGTLYTLVFNKQPINKQTIAKSLFMPVERIEHLLKQEEELTRLVFEKMEFELNPELMRRFFMYSSDSKEEQLIGYFVGMRVIERVLHSGKSMQKITAMSADDIIIKYQETL